MDREHTETTSDRQIATAIRDSASQIWLAGLGAFAKAQAEGTRVFDTLVKEGEAIQERTRKNADDTMAEARARVSGTWDRLEQVFEDRVAKALHSLNVPTHDDIETLSKRVSELTSAVKKMSGETAEAKPRRTSAKAG